MSEPISQATKTRRFTAGAVIAVGVFLGFVVKLKRTDLSEAGLDPMGLGGMAPDFLFAFGAPLLMLVSPRTIRWRSFVVTSVFILLGCVVYEFSQLRMPERTFDPKDIVASCVGALLCIGLSRILFFTGNQPGGIAEGT